MRILLALIFLLQWPGIGLSSSPQAAQVSAVYRSGQVFITWNERADLNNELYKVYRHTAPIDAASLPQAQRLATLAEGSANFYASRYNDNGTWKYRYPDISRYVIADNATQLPAGTGLFVYTVKSNQSAYYAVTYTPPGGQETLEPTWVSPAVNEITADPLPVHTLLHPATANAHLYIQYMDASQWNPTFHAPNSSNSYYGLENSNWRWAYSLQYAYEYVVVAPLAASCGGSLPASVPVVMELHGFGFNMYEPYSGYAPAQCAYFIYPVDVSETWWFGFARHHDYRPGNQPAAGDTIVNYTEQRLLRMIADLQHAHPAAAAPDLNRVYVYGHSMGGSGTLALALRYPDVFAAAYASQPMTNYLTSTYNNGFFIQNAAIKWGTPSLNLPVALSAPNGWGTTLPYYNGTGVWDWQNHQRMVQTRASDAVPFGMAHGEEDIVIDWQTQAVPFYPLIDAAHQPWAGATTDDGHHDERFDLLPPTISPNAAGVPFAGYTATLNESVPGIANASSNSAFPSTIVNRYNTGIRWAASWNAWDESPVDTPDRWEMSFCAVNKTVVGAPCGTGTNLTADITPRRTQNFPSNSWMIFHWENRRVSDNALVQSGTARARKGGVTVTGFIITPQGNRLILYPEDVQPIPIFLPIITR